MEAADDADAAIPAPMPAIEPERHEYFISAMTRV